MFLKQIITVSLDKLTFSRMEHFMSVLMFVLLPSIFFKMGRAFTVVMPDSDGSSGLLNGPQTGISNNWAQTDTHEQDAVYEIMKDTGNPWAMDIPDVCRGRWHGIECMPDKDNIFHVVSLSFGALSDDTAFPTCDPTRSIISPSIIKLPHLRTLFFYRCFTHNPQPIPGFLGRLGPTLQTLVLRENELIGPIPTELGNLTRLKVLDLHKNNLNGSIPLSLNRLTSLRSLDLSRNKLTGLVPELHFPVLNVLDLNQNHLMGPISSSLENCPNLMKADLSRNRFSGSISESVSVLNELILLDLSYNRLSGPLPFSFKKLKSLEALILKGNPMNSLQLPNDVFDGLNGLMILDLSYMNLCGLIPESLGRLTSLRVLHLGGNYFNGSIPSSFQKLDNLSELRLDNNLLTGPIPFKRNMVLKLKRKLRIYNNSGLCYDDANGFENDFVSSFDLGIGQCDEDKQSPTRTVQHISNDNRDGEKYMSNSSAFIHKNTNFHKLLLLVVLFLTTVICL